MIKVYELGFKEKGISFSPFVIAAQLFLKHKGLEFENTPLIFTEIAPTIKEVTGGKWELVPTLVFPNGDVVFDSPKIAEYLDEKYPDNPLNPNNPELDALIDDYNKNLFFPSFKNIVDELYARLDDKNQKYFKETREKFFNVPLESLCGDRDANNQQYYAGVKKIDDLLSTSKFLDGDKPLIHDYTLASRIKFYKILSPRTYEDLIVNGPNKNLKRWVEDMDKELNGYLGNRPTF